MGHATLAGKDAGASPDSSLNNSINHLTSKNAGIQLTGFATLTAEGGVPAGAAVAVMAGRVPLPFCAFVASSVFECLN